MLIGYFFDFISFITGKKLSISSVRIKKFCATTQFNANKIKIVFKAPYTLSDGLALTLKYEFINNSNDKIVFYSE